MANKISTAVGNLKTALQVLVTEGYLIAVKRSIINPFQQMQLPVLGLKIVRYGREAGKTWTAEVILMLVTKSGAAADDEANIDLAARVDAKIDALAAAGTAGAAIGRPTWEPWEMRQRADSEIVPVGSLGGLELKCEDPLLTS